MFRKSDKNTSVAEPAEGESESPAAGPGTGPTDVPDRVLLRPGETPPSDAPAPPAQPPVRPPAVAITDPAVADEAHTQVMAAPEVDDETFDRRSGWYVLRKSIREFKDDNGTDLAAALTYYSVLSIFPAALALLSIIGLVGNGQKAVDNVLDVLTPLVSSGTIENIRGPLTNLSHSQAAGATFLIGLLGALWSASAYVGAFGRAMNRVYEVDEGRAFWRLRPVNVVITVVTLVLSAVAVVILGASGPVADSLGSKLGLGDQTVTVWDYAKWPVLVIIVVLIIDVLYFCTPNVRFPKFRALSTGACVALVVWVLASAAFGLYIANFSSYDRTYGSVAGVVIALLWLWLTNVALVFGAEIDSEVERAHELHRGLPAEERLQLPVRTARGIEKAEQRRQRDQDSGREIREQRVGAGDPEDRPF
ncbi:MAG TPA: YihY/virulence factor BrkB family protein [Marmoricola sp.]